MTDEQNKEVTILAESINIALAAVEVSGMGKVVEKADESNLSKSATNLIVNQAAMGVFMLILSEKLKRMYASAKQTKG